MRAAHSVFLLVLGPLAQADGLFSDPEPLEVTLTGPLERVITESDEELEHPFVITTAGDASNVAVDVRKRGKSRLRVCRFPPLRLDFDEAADADSVFAGYDDIKLVTHCNDKRRDANILYDEYVAYRLFSLLTDYSYRTRWLRVRYVDSDNPEEEPLTQHAFLIEPGEAFADRTGTARLELPGVVYSKLDDAHATLVYVFQYVIGNTDWSLVLADGDDKCCHNGDLFEAPSGVLFVPYDFDLAGIVDASYAEPDPSLRLRSVRSRKYRGYCTEPETVHAAFDAVVAQREAIMALARNSPFASQRDLERRIEYLEDFFSEAEDGEELLETFERRCIG